MKKKLVAMLAAATMVFAFAGCGSSQEAPVEESTTAVEETTEAPTEAATEAATDDIGIDKAIEIALADAGFSANDVEITKQRADIDDGMNIYEVEFVNGETQYEYDIDEQTGNILEKGTDSIYDD